MNVKLTHMMYNTYYQIVSKLYLIGIIWKRNAIERTQRGKCALYIFCWACILKENGYFMSREEVVGKGSNVINCLAGKITKHNIRNTYAISSQSGRRDKWRYNHYLRFYRNVTTREPRDFDESCMATYLKAYASLKTPASNPSNKLAKLMKRAILSRNQMKYISRIRQKLQASDLIGSTLEKPAVYIYRKIRKNLECPTRACYDNLIQFI